MISILAKKALQFRNPNKSLVNKEAKLGESNQVSTTTKLEEAFCRVIPNKVTAVPDWVKTDPIFDWCVKEGSLMQIVTPVSSSGDDLQSQGQQQLADNAATAKKAEAEKAHADLLESLEKMTKAELIQYASETHDLDLPPSMTKVDLLSTIQEAMKAKDAAA